MENVNSIPLIRLRNNDYFQFMTAVKDLITVATPTALNVEEDFTNFGVSFTKLDDELRVDQGSIITEKLTLADNLRDTTWRALYGRTKATLLSPIAKEVEAAKRVKRVFDLYGNIAKLSYNEQTAAATNLDSDLETEEMAAHIATMGMTKWAQAHQTQNEAFNTLLNERDTELANKKSGNVREVRLELDPVYELIINRVEAMITLNMASPELETFVKELNQKIKYYNTTLASRGGRNDDESDDEVPPIDEED